MSGTLKESEVRTKNTAELLKAIMDGCEELVGRLKSTEKVGQVDTQYVAPAAASLCRARDYSWAMLNFPMFDTVCLSRLKEFEFKDLRITNDKRYTGKLVLPHFAWVRIPSPGCGVEDGSDQAFDSEYAPSMSFGEICIPFDSRLWIKNAENMRGAIEHGRHMGNINFRLSAIAPRLPVGVQRRVDEVHDRFSSLHLVWEAEWTPRPLGDPLVIGVIMGRAFLVDQFDVTKLERYIVSEFTGKA